MNREKLGILCVALLILAVMPMFGARRMQRRKLVEPVKKEISGRVNAYDDSGRTPLMNAALFGTIGEFKDLLEKSDIKVNLFDKPPYNKPKETVLHMLAHNPVSFRDPTKNKDEIEDRRRRINKRMGFLEEILKRKDIDVNMKCSWGLTPLMEAVIGDFTEAIKLLLKNKNIRFDIKNNDGRDVLDLAWFLKRKEFVGLIENAIEKKAKSITDNTERKKFLDEIFNSYDKYGKTSLMRAVSFGPLELFKKLAYDPVVDVNLLSKDQDGARQSALHLLMYGGGDKKRKHHSLKEILNRKDLNVNIQDSFGLTPLMWAVSSNDIVAVKLLLQREDINLDLKDEFNKTVFDLAELLAKSGEPDIKNLLNEKRRGQRKQEPSYQREEAERIIKEKERRLREEKTKGVISISKTPLESALLLLDSVAGKINLESSLRDKLDNQQKTYRLWDDEGKYKVWAISYYFEGPALDVKELRVYFGGADPRSSHKSTYTNKDLSGSQGKFLAEVIKKIKDRIIRKQEELRKNEDIMTHLSAADTFLNFIRSMPKLDEKRFGEKYNEDESKYLLGDKEGKYGVWRLYYLAKSAKLQIFFGGEDLKKSSLYEYDGRKLTGEAKTLFTQIFRKLKERMNRVRGKK